MSALASYFRLARAGLTLARAGATGFVDPDDLPAGPRRLVGLGRRLEPRGLDDTARGERLCTALNRLGPSYIKLGQFLATRPDIVGIDMARALSALKDDMPPFPTDEAKAIVTANLNDAAAELLEDFSESVAAASIAQVHRARIRIHAEAPGTADVAEAEDGKEPAADLPAEGHAGGEPDDGDERYRTVAVKVLRPDARRRFRRDLTTFYAAARLIERVSPEARRLKPVAVVETLERSVVLEMDLRLEAAALSEMADNTAGEEEFRVPAVDWRHTGRDVLVTEWIEGIKMKDLAAIDAAGHDREKIAATVVQSFLRHALRDGFFHADMHEGNLFVDHEGRLVAVDLGIMGRLGHKERRFLAEILYGFIRRDYQRIAEVHFEAGYVPANHAVEDFAQALRAIGEPIHGQRASDISMARLLGLLFEITDIFDMETRPELIMLQKTMVVVEGVARQLDPDFDMWTAAEPVVSQWMSRHVGPAGQLEKAAQGLSAIGRLAGQLPELASRAERLSTELDRMSGEGLRLDQETIRAVAKAESRYNRGERVALWLIAVSVALIAGSLVLL
ncbi:MAG TPA: AarF/UbiB family protein [Afifellaceae bacterium]|nr:AarF/UbiB family protein [Afifellaceae bacterium]